MPHKIKQYILQTLRASEGTWVSSEALRQPFDISRAAISKQVRGLREKGYRIESSPRKGYRLFGRADVLAPESLYLHLEGTRFAKGTIKVSEVTQSTNDDAKQLALEGCAEGSLVLADIQVAGRGRRGRVWFGNQGDSLLFSMVLRPPLEPMRCGLLPLLVAVAVREALDKLGVKGVGIKWPNDLLVDGRKIGGILCEISTDFDRVEYAVVGVGLNVNNEADSFPDELSETACSLKMATGETWSRLDILTEILRKMDQMLRQAWSGNFRNILEDWRRSTLTSGNRVTTTLPNGSKIQGTALDIDDSGALLLKDDHGKIHLLTSGEIS
ncbi:MAG: biotin--[acetyl-CoA-carboxylase] ligase [Verrucomicrobia bacterium]|nr:biotin--[acetyl-CoA-carboxylase] ligase [Verrucomicrobiota bacterium]MCH8510391.1 biotin--[acetyl-CoA-carboxylase] ligase [Kiritimatiellia bacterium]